MLSQLATSKLIGSFCYCIHSASRSIPTVMPLVEFTANLARQTTVRSCLVDGGIVAEALEAVFSQLPGLRGYILDDQGSLRTHVIVFLDGEAMRDRKHLSDAVRPDSEIVVMQALSGG